jgi:protein-L-isoaspartate O-methyltransferase
MNQYERLLSDLTEAGELGAEWRGAFECAPRSAFIPDVIWLPDEDAPRGYRQVTRTADPEPWADAVAADDVVVTQLDDGADDGPGVSTSSGSMPRLVARMLRQLDVRDGHQVLDIGTGTGWTAALLSARLGSYLVTTVEVDAAIAAAARTRLDCVGFHPHSVIADGTLGCPERAPFDRIHSTAAIQHVPRQWIEQIRPGGVIITPWGTPFCNAGLLRLTVGVDGSASGRFVGNVSFMWVRDQRPPSAPADPAPERTSASATDPELALDSVNVAFAIGLRVPGTRYTHRWNDADRHGTLRMVLHDGDGSWASVRYKDWAQPDAVQQAGPRSLWDEVTRAHAWWEDRGKPELTRFGVTATEKGSQEVWLDTPESVVGQG